MAYKLAAAAAFIVALLDTSASAHPHSNIDLFPRSNPGINCDGSAMCTRFSSGDAIADILAKVNTIAVGTRFDDGDKLACSGNEMFDDHNGGKTSLGGDKLESKDGLCAMVGHNTQYTHAGPADNGQSNSAAAVIEDLIYHGCKACGTAPIVREGNSLAQGSIVVNYVQNVCWYTNSNACTQRDDQKPGN